MVKFPLYLNMLVFVMVQKKKTKKKKKKKKKNTDLQVLFVFRFYGPVSPMGSCRARSVYLTTRLLGRLSPLSG